jgi:hypothetical protein
MAAKEKLAKGKIQLYCYIKEANKKMLSQKAAEFGMSQSKVLDLILDKTREKGSDFKITHLVKV